jgi:predicted DNA repair protein MutK
MAAEGRTGLSRALGEKIVLGMPMFLNLLVIVGTAAMIWVGGAIIVHGLHEVGFHAPYDIIHSAAVSIAGAVPTISGALEWVVTAILDGLVGVALGMLLLSVFIALRSH